jgi:hypothetical protein
LDKIDDIVAKFSSGDNPLRFARGVRSGASAFFDFSGCLPASFPLPFFPQASPVLDLKPTTSMSPIRRQTTERSSKRHSIAMGQASAEVKKSATYITGGMDKEGFCQRCR